MATEDNMTLIQRRDRVLKRLDESHQALLNSLKGIDPEEAFLGSRWSVWEVLNHLDTENYVAALEKIMSGEMDMLPAFGSREEKLQEDITHLNENLERFKALVAGLTEEKMAQPVIQPNPHNNYPGLTLLELVERSSGHEATHARQIVETRKYVTAFRAKERAITFIVLNPGSPSVLGESTIGLLKYADNVAGSPEAISAVTRFATGSELTLDGNNTIEVISRLARDARAGTWNVVCTIGSPAESHQELLRVAEKYCDKVVITQASQ